MAFTDGLLVGSSAVMREVRRQLRDLAKYDVPVSLRGGSVVNGVTRIVKYAYNQAGALDTLTDPWNGAYRFGWDAANRARTITNPYSETFSVRHSPEGLVTSVVFPTGTDSLTYDASHLLRKAGLNAEVVYTRDTVTKGFASIKLGGMTQSVSYDGFGRLAGGAQDSATATYGPASESSSYDAAGNRTGTGYSYAVTNALRGRPAISGDGWAPGDSLVYDAAGNPTWWKNKTTNGYDSLTWDAENRLIRLRRYNASNQLQLDVNYAYDGFGRRVKKWGSGTGLNQRLYVWNGWELLAETDLSGNSIARYTHHPEGLDFPMAMRRSNATSFFHLDGQGNVYVLTNTSGTRVSEYRYRAWGDRYVTPTGDAVVSPFGYKGREEDRETGLVYMRHRFYSPRLERFVNQDPMGIAGGLNTFAFAGMNPVNVADPLGLDPDDPCDPRFYICLPPIFVLAWVPGDGRDLADLLALDNFMKGMMTGSWPYGSPETFLMPGGGGPGGEGSWGPVTGGGAATGQGSNTGSRGDDEFNACVAGSMARRAGQGILLGAALGLRQGFTTGLRAAAVNGARAAVIGGALTVEFVGSGAVLAGGATFLVTLGSYVIGSTVAYAVAGGVGGAAVGVAEGLAPGSCVGTLN